MLLIKAQEFNDIKNIFFSGGVIAEYKADWISNLVSYASY